MKRIYLTLFVGLLFAACTKVNETTEQAEEQGISEIMTRSGGEEDPYKLSFIQSILDEATAKTRATRIVLKPTDYYVRFMPQDSIQLATLEALPIPTFDHPIVGDYTPEPETGFDEEQLKVFNWIYAVVPANFKFPAGIQYEKIYDVFIQTLDNTSQFEGVEQLPLNTYKQILQTALAQTGNAPATRADAPPWRPSARFRLHVNYKRRNDTLALNNLTVKVIQGTKVEQKYTNRSGETDDFGDFIGNVDYECVWEGNQFTLRQNTTWNMRSINFSSRNSRLDHTFVAQDGIHYVFAGVHRAMVAYCTETFPQTAGLIKEPRHFNVGVADEKAGAWQGRYLRTIFAHPLYIHARKPSNSFLTSTETMETIFHELGHASHCYEKGNTKYAEAFIGCRKDMESWAEGICYAHMRVFFPSFKTESPDPETYTSLVECLMKNGFTLEQIQRGFFSSINSIGSWNNWRDGLKGLNVVPDHIVDLIFKNPNDMTFNIETFLTAKSGAKRYEPVRISFDTTDVGGCKAIPDTWQIVDAGGTVLYDAKTNFIDESEVQVFRQSSNELICSFTKFGDKRIRNTISMPVVGENVREVEVGISTSSIISGPTVLKPYKNYTYTLSDFSMIDNVPARITGWRVNSSSSVSLEEMTDKKLTINFNSEGRKQLILLVDCGSNILAECPVADVQVGLVSSVIDYAGWVGGKYYDKNDLELDLEFDLKFEISNTEFPGAKVIGCRTSTTGVSINPEIRDNIVKFKPTSAGVKELTVTIQLTPNRRIDFNAKVYVKPRDASTIFYAYKPVGGFQYDEPFRVQYMGAAEKVTIHSIELRSAVAYYIMIPPSTYQYTVVDDKNFDVTIEKFGDIGFDYRLIINSSVGRAEICVSNTRDKL